MKKDKTEPQTIEEWRRFMNGYRDPETNAELQRSFEAGDWDSNGWRGESSGSGARQCGMRKEGGTYASCPLSPYGKPLEHFITCKPVPVVADDYNLSNVGVKLVDVEETCLKCAGKAPTRKAGKLYSPCSECHGSGKETVTHVFDIVGQEYYPNIADFLEEARRMGVSRRLELEEGRQYARLSSRSRLMLLHHKAVMAKPGDVLNAMSDIEERRYRRAGCPKALKQHELEAPGTCAALYWNVLEDGVATAEMSGETGEPVAMNNFVQRNLAAGPYRGYALKPDVNPDYSLGIFAVFPLVKIQVVDPDGNYEDRVIRAEKARVDVESVEC